MNSAMLHNIGKRTIILGCVFLFFAGIYILTDSILRQNSLKYTGEGEHKAGNFSGVVGWLPQSAKDAIEFRAKSLYLQNRMKRTRDIDEKVKAIFAFGDYIKKRDPKGSDSVMVSIVTNPEFKTSRFAFDGYARLLLDDKSAHPVSIKELHTYIATLEWPEDKYKAWQAVQARLSALRAKWNLWQEVMSPLLAEIPPYRNYERFFNDAVNRCKREKRTGEQANYQAQLNQIRKKPYLPNALLNASAKYRNQYRELRQEIAKDKDLGSKIQHMTALALLTREVYAQESNDIFKQMLDDPKMMADNYAFYPLSKLLLYRKSKHWISVARYREIREKITEPHLRFEAWSAGLEQLQMLKSKPKVILDYLTPLLKEDVKYQEYSELFRELAKQARALGDSAKAEPAEKFLNMVQNMEMPTLYGESETAAGGKR